jgi:hypothetical protein
MSPGVGAGANMLPVELSSPRLTRGAHIGGTHVMTTFVRRARLVAVAALMAGGVVVADGSRFSDSPP